jgi:hypothetical protein
MGDGNARKTYRSRRQSRSQDNATTYNGIEYGELDQARHKCTQEYGQQGTSRCIEKHGKSHRGHATPKPFEYDIDPIYHYRAPKI